MGKFILITCKGFNFANKLCFQQIQLQFVAERSSLSFTATS